MPLIPPYDNSAQTMKFSIGGLDDPLYSDLSTMKCVGRIQVWITYYLYTAVASLYKSQFSIGDNICTAAASYSSGFVQQRLYTAAALSIIFLNGKQISGSTF